MSMLLWLSSGCISAWAIEAHEAEQLSFDAGLTLSALVDSTLARHPGAVMVSARAATADAEQQS